MRTTLAFSLLSLFCAFAVAVETPFTAYKDGHASASAWYGSGEQLLLRAGETKGWVNHALADGVSDGLTAGRLSLFIKDVRSPGKLEIHLAKALGYLENQTKLSYLEEASNDPVGQIDIGYDEVEEMVSVRLSNTFVEAVKNGLYDGLILVPTAGLDADLGAVESSRGAFLFLDYAVQAKGNGETVSAVQVAEQLKNDAVFLNSVRGPQGPKGEGLQIDSTGSASDRDKWSSASTGAVWLVPSTGGAGVLWVKTGSGWEEMGPISAAESLEQIPGQITAGQIADASIGTGKLTTGTLNFANDGTRTLIADSASGAKTAATAKSADYATVAGSANSVDWSKIKGIPADIADGDDVGSTGSTYSAGSGLKLSGSEFSVDYSEVASKSALDGKASATDVYSKSSADATFKRKGQTHFHLISPTDFFTNWGNNHYDGAPDVETIDGKDKLSPYLVNRTKSVLAHAPLKLPHGAAIKSIKVFVSDRSSGSPIETNSVVLQINLRYLYATSAALTGTLANLVDFRSSNTIDTLFASQNASLISNCWSGLLNDCRVIDNRQIRYDVWIWMNREAANAGTLRFNGAVIEYTL